jgi:hypothetical protein
MGDTGRRCVSALSLSFRLAVALDVQSFVGSLRAVRCGVMVAGCVSRDMGALLGTLEAVPPLVLVPTGHPSAPTASPVIAEILHRVVDPADVDSELVGAASAGVIEDLLRRSRRAVLASPDLALEPKLRRVLARAFDSPPLVSVHAAARIAGWRTRTLERYWSRCCRDPHHAPTLKRLLMAIHLLRAAVAWLSEPDLGWSAIADRLGVTVRTMEANSRRWTGLAPRDLASDTLLALVPRMEEGMFRWLHEGETHRAGTTAA